MPITIDCPNCEKTLRINNSAAGKKVKCPKCQELFRVPAEPVEEEEAAEERPARREKTKPSGNRKGKSKKKAGNKSLVLGLAIGGGVLVLLLIGGIIWLATPGASSDSSHVGNGGTNSNEKPVKARTADEFYEEWTEHKGDMEQRYRNSFVQLSGVVQDVVLPYSGIVCVVLKLKEKTTGFWCYPVDKQPWTKVSVGQEVKIKGQVSDYRTYAELRECVFVDLTPKPVPTLTAEQLAKEFAANADAAVAKYGKQRLILTGVVAAKQERWRQPILKGTDAIQLECSVAGVPDKDLDSIQIGQQIKLLVKVPDATPRDPAVISLQNCVIID
jgi:predicted Zn finger-like uncharacterized protein